MGPAGCWMSHNSAAVGTGTSDVCRAQRVQVVRSDRRRRSRTHWSGRHCSFGGGIVESTERVVEVRLALVGIPFGVVVEVAALGTRATARSDGLGPQHSHGVRDPVLGEPRSASDAEDVTHVVKEDRAYGNVAICQLSCGPGSDLETATREGGQELAAVILNAEEGREVGGEQQSDGRA